MNLRQTQLGCLFLNLPLLISLVYEASEDGAHMSGCCHLRIEGSLGARLRVLAFESEHCLKAPSESSAQRSTVNNIVTDL